MSSGSSRGRIRRLKLVRLDVAQRGCPVADASREHGVYVEITSAALRGDDSILMAWARGGGIRGFLRDVRDAENVKRFHVLTRDGDSAWLYIVKESSGILKTIYEAEGILASSIVIQGGVKRFTVMLPSNNIGRLKAAAHRNLSSRGFDVYISDATQMLRDDASLMMGVHIPFSMVRTEVTSRLTPMEMRILADVVASGYFSWPRKSSLENIARKHGISKSTASYHIRNAERKILGLLVGKYKILDRWW